MTDYSGLVGRLRFNCTALCLEAASAIEAQRERIERLEGALRDLLVDYELPYWEQSGAAVGPARVALEAKS